MRSVFFVTATCWANFEQHSSRHVFMWTLQVLKLVDIIMHFSRTYRLEVSKSSPVYGISPTTLWIWLDFLIFFNRKADYKVKNVKCKYDNAKSRKCIAKTEFKIWRRHYIFICHPQIIFLLFLSFLFFFTLSRQLSSVRVQLYIPDKGINYDTTQDDSQPTWCHEGGRGLDFSSWCGSCFTFTCPIQSRGGSIELSCCA